MLAIGVALVCAFIVIIILKIQVNQLEKECGKCKHHLAIVERELDCMVDLVSGMSTTIDDITDIQGSLVRRVCGDTESRE